MVATGTRITASNCRIPQRLKVQKRKRVKGRDQAAPEQGQSKEKLERDDGAQHLGQVTRGDGHLGQNPEDEVEPG